MVKPSAWNGTGARYDYALLVIGDHAPDSVGSIEWDPEPAQFATNTCTSLLGDNVNMRGYPLFTKACADAAAADAGQCGGYCYTEADPITSCTDDAIYYSLDSQEAQSGSPVYRYNSGTGVRTVIGINRGTSGSSNYGHRIRSGSYNVICNNITNPINESSFFTNPSC